MTKNWQRHLIQSHLSECQSYLEEVRLTGDLDLIEELAAKMCDVLLVYRRNQQAEPTTFTFSDGVTRHLGAMALAHAEHAIADEFGADMDDEYPAILCRGERGA